MLPEGKVSGQNQHGYTIGKVDRFDAGRYTCKADNGVGTPATAHIALQVLCKLSLIVKTVLNIFGNTSDPNSLKLGGLTTICKLLYKS